MKGTSLLETVVVIAIIAILGLIGVNSINSFRREATLDNTANELISEIRLARSKSMNGELIGSETEDDFTPNGLPEYGLSVISGTYKLVRQCLKIDGTTCSTEPAIESVDLSSQYTLSPDGSFYFARITGNSSGRVITFTEKNGSRGRQISISDKFVITITRI